MRRKDRQQTEEFAIKLLDKCEYAVLSTVGSDGMPYAVPVSPVKCGNFVYIHCAPAGRKLDNIKFNKNVCLVCVGRTRLLPEEYSTEYESAISFGECEIVEDREEKIFALRKLCEKYAPNNMDAFDAAINRSLHRTCICKISIREISGKAKVSKKSKAPRAQ